MSLEGGQDRHHAGSAVGLLLPSQTCEILAKRHLAQPQGAPFTRLPASDRRARRTIVGISNHVDMSGRYVSHFLSCRDRRYSHQTSDTLVSSDIGIHMIVYESIL